MERSELMQRITAKLGTAVLSIEEARNDDVLVVLDRQQLVSAVGILKNDPGLAFSTLMNHLGVDYGDRMAVIYNLYSPAYQRKLTVKVEVDRQKPEAPSLERAYHGINWYERETFDLLGIRFIGHSNLKRLLLPDDWKGFPLRKDYVFPETYNNMDLGRVDLLDDSPASGASHV